MTSRFDPNQMHFFYNGEYLGSCNTDYIECPKLLELMESDSRAASQILTYMNSLGDPVFSTEPGGYEAETDVSKVDIEDLYSTFMQEIDYSYSDFPNDFYVGGDYLLSDFEIFVGPVAEENVVESATDVSAKRYIKSFTADDLKAQLGSNYPKGGYLYIFKHGIGPGTIPSDVKVVKVKDLPNYYTAVWLDRFLTDEELKQYDIPDETRINDYLGRIGYCKKNGDVVPCEDITASTMPKPTVDSVLQMIADKKIIFKNDVAYWSRGKGVLPKEYRDCIAQTEYAHWINEWSCEQAEKYGSRAYYDYDGEAEVDSCSDIKAATEPNVPDANKSKLARECIKQAKEIRDYFQSHNNNLNRRQEQFLEDLSDGIDSRSIVAIREAIENLKYNSKNLRNEQYYLIEDLYNEFNFADGKFEGMGRPGSEDVQAGRDIKCSDSITASLQDAGIQLIANIGYIANENGKFDICLVETPHEDMALATYDPTEDEFDVLTEVSDISNAYERANALFRTQPEYVLFENDNYTDACTAVKAYSYTPSRKRCTNVTDEVLEYTKDAYPALYDELASKDIWVSIWSDGEYSLSYNSIKNPDNFLSDSVKQDFMQAMEDLFPGSFWGDLVDIDACSAVTASTTPESLGLEPRQRTAVDGKTWWVVYDTVARKYLDTIMYFGKYKTKKDCQYAIDRAIEKYGDDLNRTIRNHRKYFSNPGNDDTVTASTGSTLQYADKVEFEDIYPSDRDISFFFTSDDVAYAKELLGDVTGLTGFSIQVSLPKDYNGDWQEALIYISPKTSDGHGGESDSDWTDITFDISDADMQSLVEQSWDEYKKRGWNDPDTKVTGSTKYFANMVSASADDDGFEQLVDGPDNDTDEYIEYGKYYVAGYLRGTYRGLMSDLYSDDFEEILSAAADMAGQGLYIEITNRADGRSMRYTPEDFEVAAEYGEYPDHIREDLAL